VPNFTSNKTYLPNERERLPYQNSLFLRKHLYKQKYTTKLYKSPKTKQTLPTPLQLLRYEQKKTLFPVPRFTIPKTNNAHLPDTGLPSVTQRE